MKRKKIQKRKGFGFGEKILEMNPKAKEKKVGREQC